VNFAGSRSRSSPSPGFRAGTPSDQVLPHDAWFPRAGSLSAHGTPTFARAKDLHRGQDRQATASYTTTDERRRRHSGERGPSAKMVSPSTSTQYALACGQQDRRNVRSPYDIVAWAGSPTTPSLDFINILLAGDKRTKENVNLGRSTTRPSTADEQAALLTGRSASPVYGGTRPSTSHRRSAMGLALQRNTREFVSSHVGCYLPADPRRMASDGPALRSSLTSRHASSRERGLLVVREALRPST